MGMSQSLTTTKTIKSKKIGKDKDSKEHKRLIHFSGRWKGDMKEASMCQRSLH